MAEKNTTTVNGIEIDQELYNILDGHIDMCMNLRLITLPIDRLVEKYHGKTISDFRDDALMELAAILLHRFIGDFDSLRKQGGSEKIFNKFMRYNFDYEQALKFEEIYGINITKDL